MPDQVRGWRRNLVRQQTELDRLHGRPPCTVTSVQPAPGHPRSGRKGAETSTDRPSRSATDAQRPRPVTGLPPAAWSRSVHAAGISRLDPSGSTTSSSRRAVPAHAAQHRQRPALERMPSPGQPDHGARLTAVTGRPPDHLHPAASRMAAPPPRPARRYPHPGQRRLAAGQPASPRRCSPRPAAPAAHRPSTAAPPAPRPPPPRSRPPRPPGRRNGSHPTSTATCRKSSRSSHVRCAISSSAAASAAASPFAHARIASARSSKHVVRRGVLRRNRACPPHGPAPGKDHGQAGARAGQGVPQGRDHDGRR